MGTLIRSHFSIQFPYWVPSLILWFPCSPTMHSKRNLMFFYLSWFPSPLGIPILDKVVNALHASTLLIEINVSYVLHFYHSSIVDLSQSYPGKVSYLLFTTLLSHTWKETFPWMSLSCMCFLPLSIGMFHFLEIVCLLMTLVSSLFYYKHILFFIQAS